jgi:pimeloyl-ACP methyl ester carboxylesterase
MSRRTLAGAFVVVSLLLSACTENSHASASSALVPSRCPADVSDAVVGTVQCAYLTVPESRAHGQDSSVRQIKVFVAVLRAEGGAGREPILVPSLAGTPGYGGIAPMVQRTGRDVIIVDTRGVAHSRPALYCPHVVASLRGSWDSATRDPGTRSALLGAVSACHDTLADSGIDLAAYDVGQAAVDLVDLRSALGVPRWTVVSFGAASRVALELLRIDPDHVSSLILDSPETPQSDPRSLAGPTTEHAVRAVLDSCARSTECRSSHQSPRDLLDRALTGLDAEPMRIELPTAHGHRSMLLDSAMLVRWLRQLLSDGSSGPLFAPASVPGLLSAVVERRTDRLRAIATQFVQDDDPLCLGYRPKCLANQHPALGVELGVLCGDVAPNARHTIAARQPDGFAAAFDGSPWWDLCRAWPIDASPAAVASPPAWDGPVLVAFGRFDPYTPQPQVRRDLAGLTGASYMEDPAAGYNVLPNPCLVDVRNAWLNRPYQFHDNPCAHKEGIPWHD